MKVTAQSPCMIMGCRSYTAKNGVTYFNADVYDLVSGTMYECELSQENFNSVNNVQKPLQVKGLALEIGKPYQGRVRMELVGWS